MPKFVNKKVLLVGWDGADWGIARPLINAGRLPHLTALIESGVSTSVGAPPPLDSTSLWTSVATGKRALKHGIFGPAELGPEGHVRPASTARRGAQSLASILSHEGLNTHLINWPASGSTDVARGVCTLDGWARQGQLQETVFPAEVRSTIGEFRLRPADLSIVDLAAFIPALADQSEMIKHPLAQACAAFLAETASTHAAITWAIEHQPDWNFAAVLYSSMERFAEAFMPFQAPRMAHVSDQDFAFFQNVVSATYEFHDAMLGRLLELAGPGITVLLVSDHGTAHDAQRIAVFPQTALQSQSQWHRNPGLLVLAGPNIKQDDTFEGANVLDVAPTVLTLFELPYGFDMDGRPLVEVFQTPPTVRGIPSWDAIIPLPVTAQEFTPDAWAAASHLIEIGYFDPTARQSPHSWAVYSDNLFALARSCRSAFQSEIAISILKFLTDQVPTNHLYHHELFLAYRDVGRNSDAKRQLDGLSAQGASGPMLELAYASLELAAGNAAAAAERLNGIMGVALVPEVHTLIGEVYLALRLWSDAERAFDAALDQDQSEVTAWGGKAAAAMGRDDASASADAAMHAVALQADYSQGHFYLAQALYRLGHHRDAERAARRTIQLRPNSIPAHQILLSLYTGPLADPQKADEVNAAIEAIKLKLRIIDSMPAAAP